MSTDQSTGAAAASTPASTGTPAAAPGSSSSAPAFTWPDNWRQHMAGEDQGVLTRLQRFQTPADIFKSFREIESRMSKGELRSQLPPNATEDDLKRHRTENNLPLEAKDYKVTMPQGREAPPDDDKLLTAMRGVAHKSLMPQGTFDELVKTFYAEVDRSETELDQAEEKAVKATEAELRKEWGADADTNFAMVENLKARYPVIGQVMEGYIETEQGRVPFRASKEAMNMLAALEREINPTATVVTGGIGDMRGLEQEIKQIEGWMGSPKNTPEWRKYWKDETVQARYRQLIDAREALKKRQAA